jgi:hypothetical protein
MLFTDRSLMTMVHGVGLSGAALMGVGAALFTMVVLRPGSRQPDPTPRQVRLMTMLLVFSTLALWFAVLAGTYLVFPAYRATPPAGADLAAYPRALLLSSPQTAWLHEFAMEIKEHVPWIAAMLVTAAAFVVWRDPIRALRDRPMYRATVTLLTVGFILASWAGLLGVFVNKLAPLE